jgi:AcrR family transcriptional regulator
LEARKEAALGPIDRREREKQILRRKILDVSRQLFAEQGYDAVTMRTIATAIEYSPRTIYLHFKDKEDLIRELCREDFQTFGEGLAALTSIQDPLERLRAIGQGYATFAMEFPHHYRLMFMNPPPMEEPACDGASKGNPEVDAYALVRATVQEALDAGLLRPEHTDADLVAQVVWSGLHGVMALSNTHERNTWIPWAPIAARVATMNDLLIRGLRR